MNDLNNLFNIEYNKEIPAPGKLLVAEPFLADYPFTRAVVLLINHSVESSMGLVLNKPIFQYLNNIILEFKDTKKIPLYRGGPLNDDILFFIHNHPEIPNTLPISKGLYLNGDFEYVKELIINHKIDSDDFRFFLGYSGWGDAQLEQELLANTWLVTQEPVEYIVKQSSETLWEDILFNMGDNYKMWTRFPLLPSLN